MEILDEVTAQIGQGGMRGVSRARDLKPKRTVARRQLPVPFRAMVRVTAILLLTAVVASTKAVAQQPAFAPGSGPTVLFDLGHNSLFLRGTNLSPMTRLQDDGYLTQTLTGPFTEDALAGVDIVMILSPLADRNALPPRPADCPSPPDAECFEAIRAQIPEFWRHPIPSAFSEAEITILREWVGEGGALLLVLDHFPMSGAAQELGAAFGIEISNGLAADGALLAEQGVAQAVAQGAGSLVFERTEGGVADDPITNGRTPGQRVDAFGFFGGSAFRLPPQGRSLLTFGSSFVSLLPEVMWQFSETTSREDIGGWSGGGVLRVGQGRVAIYGELGIFAGLAEPQAWAERRPELQNPQLFMNTLHWLSGLLD